MNATVVNWQDVEGRRISVGPLGSACSDLGLAAGTQRLGLRRFVIEPGKRSTPAHTHSGEEEIFCVGLAAIGTIAWTAVASSVKTGVIFVGFLAALVTTWTGSLRLSSAVHSDLAEPCDEVLGTCEPAGEATFEGAPTA